MVIQPVILSGGSGSRLWPLSREYYPKQLLALVNEHTLIQDTVQRLQGMDQQFELTLRPSLVVCNEQHRFLIAEQLRATRHLDSKIVLEPEGRNTAPALSLAAWAARQNGDHDDPVLLVMPADHVIENVEAFQQAVAFGAELAQGDVIITFGIVPNGPATGYGYIKKHADELAHQGSLSAHVIDQFVEKPDLAKAQAYVDSGDYFWNSGMFMLRSSVWLREIKRYAPDLAGICEKAYRGGSDDHDFYRVDKTIFSTCPSDSIDYAVMEKLNNGNAQTQAVVIPVSVGWSDIGAWSALKEVLPKDDDGNVIKGDVIAQDTQRSMVVADHRMVATVGLSDVTVVETADAVLVVNNEHAEAVKDIVTLLKSKNRQERLTHRQVFRPWGSYEGIDTGERFQVKRLKVNPGATLSLQMHHHRAEHWIVVRGTAKVTCGDKEYLISENQSTYIPIGEKHRLANPGKVPLEIIEVQSGSYLGEDDIVRFQDDYGRLDSC